MKSIPSALTIAGSDSGGGAGIQADLLTFAAMGVYGTTAITCLTAQNPDSVIGAHPVPSAFLLEQIRQVDVFFAPRAVKTGMLYSTEIIDAVADWLGGLRRPMAVVIDPVMVSTSGSVLLLPEAVEAVRERLVPLATVVTPNLDEVRVLAGSAPSHAGEMEEAARALAAAHGVAFLLKGGHLEGEEILDVLAMPNGERVLFRDRRVGGVDTHGTGCTLAAATAAQLAKGMDLPEAVASARRHLRRALENPVMLGKRRFLPQGGPSRPLDPATG